ncbi:hypothetical protein ANCDUO_00729 [Ancylostoma duodenale]|uniref:Calponin-homology (CH) domain-containing protein n=1 Tax=Ancylostoma duodenale TaxID=51022 RepID=A0A0C2HBB8_9BILA|nr:hypothetical protein ANCDUO_00729 [Ancylostoma duodenale]
MAVTFYTSCKLEPMRARGYDATLLVWAVEGCLAAVKKLDKNKIGNAGCKVDDLFVDLRDGFSLITLLEVLTGERLLADYNTV